jgi:hypothetical protein
VQHALGFVRVRLTMAAQVYGGSLSFVVGALMSSRSADYSVCSAGGTVVSDLSIVFNKNSISGSQAATLTTGGTFHAPQHPSYIYTHAHVNLFKTVLFTRFKRPFCHVSWLQRTSFSAIVAHAGLLLI